ncbi:MAG: hypothetical protein O2973_06415 [Gemmatimonadetes bacterium]|nr:hypothetical protein [Gemmatimonadota bacterium]
MTHTSRVGPVRGSRRAVFVGVALVAAALAGACTESIDGGDNCAIAAPLCPGQQLEIRDTIIDPILAYDSTYAGFPGRGIEPYLALVSSGNDLETVAILRFDTLITHYVPPDDTAYAITYVDSVFVRLWVDLTGSQVPDSVRIDLYDVNDTTAADSADSPLVARFAPQFLIGGATFAKAKIVDSVFVPVSDSAMLAALADSSTGWQRLRVGVRVSGPGPVAFRIGAVEGGLPAELRYRPRPDSGTPLLEIPLASAGPVGREDIRLDLLDYSVVTKNNLPTIANTMLLGGVPGRRAYLRFDIPRWLSDSSTIVRATLRLTQVAYPFGGPLDTVVVHPRVGLASFEITDLRRASTLIAGPGVVISDSLSVVPGESGVRELEMFSLVRAWGSQAGIPGVPPRALVLTVSEEGTLPRLAAFWSSSAGAGLRPAMRITYTRNSGFGVP